MDGLEKGKRARGGGKMEGVGRERRSEKGGRRSMEDKGSGRGILNGRKKKDLEENEEKKRNLQSGRRRMDNRGREKG